MDIYHNKQIIYTKELKAQDKVSNSIYVYSPVQLKKSDSLFLVFKLIPRLDSTSSSYLFNIKDRNVYLKNNPEEYRKMLIEEANSNNTTSGSTPSKTTSNNAGMFGERYNVSDSGNSHEKNTPKHIRKENRKNGIINFLGFLFGM